MSKLNEIITAMPDAKFGFDKNHKMGLAGVLKEGVIHGLRHPPEKGTSGWYVWQGEYKQQHDFFKPIHMYHVIEKNPELEKYFILPPGYRFLVDTESGYEDVWFDRDLLNI